MVPMERALLVQLFKIIVCHAVSKGKNLSERSAEIWTPLLIANLLWFASSFEVEVDRCNPPRRVCFWQWRGIHLRLHFLHY